MNPCEIMHRTYLSKISYSPKLITNFRLVPKWVGLHKMLNWTPNDGHTVHSIKHIQYFSGPGYNAGNVTRNLHCAVNRSRSGHSFIIVVQRVCNNKWSVCAILRITLTIWGLWLTEPQNWALPNFVVQVWIRESDQIIFIVLTFRFYFQFKTCTAEIITVQRIKSMWESVTPDTAWSLPHFHPHS